MVDWGTNVSMRYGVSDYSLSARYNWILNSLNPRYTGYDLSVTTLSFLFHDTGSCNSEFMRVSLKKSFHIFKIPVAKKLIIFVIWLLSTNSLKKLL